MSKNAIVVLSRGYQNTNGYQNLINRNRHIYENIVSKSNDIFDVIIFHEGNILKEHQQYISKNSSPLNLKFIDVKNSYPKTAFDDKKNQMNLLLCPPTPQSQSFPLGYKHMCHFWSIDFFDYLSNYKYIIRIDDDCFVQRFNPNILTKMRDEKIYFSSPLFQGQDEDYVIVGLKKLWETFLSENGVIPYNSFEQIKCPYTNFMILDIEYFFENDLVNLFLDYVDDSHGIYSNRWGDLPIWGVILSTLIDEKHYYEDKETSYFHGSHNTTIN